MYFHVLDILEKEECDTVILGAFGCGVFGNDPKLSKDREFYSAGSVIFAIPNELSVNHHAFKEVFS